MLSFYETYIARENEYYSTLNIGKPTDVKLYPAQLDDALNWLVEGSRSVVDFGCGSGALAILCALRGVEKVLGIDLAEEGIRIAAGCAVHIPQCRFQQGSIEKLLELPSESCDGVILSNILDNMRPEDALSALGESLRILKPGGKAMIKLNPYLSEVQIYDWKIRRLEGELLDDGLLLWNKEDVFWQELLQSSFAVVARKDIYYPEYEKTERLFCCEK